jgi:hypothetical protein
MLKYPSLRTKLLPDDTSHLAQILHTFIRKAQDGRDKAWLISQVNLLARDLQTGELAGSAHASSHILSIFREARRFSEGEAFWAWLLKQDSQHIGMSTFGAGIELLAYAGSSLESLEGMFIEALQRFQVPFAEYHFSPNAILPDRTQPFPKIKGMSMGLLQGIIVARLLHGDLKNAYHALDAALRIMPTQVPSHIFHIFCNERPLAEKYKVFLIACRSRIPLYPGTLQRILQATHPRYLQGQFDEAYIQKRVRAIKASLKVVLAYTAAGGKLDEGHLNKIITEMTLLIRSPPRGDIKGNVEPGWRQFNQEVARHAEQLLKTFLPFVVSKVLVAHHGLIVLAGKSRDADLLCRTVANLQHRGLRPNEKTYRLILRAAGECGDTNRMKSAWEMLVRDAEEKNRSLEPADQAALVEATSYSRCIAAAEFLQEEAGRLQWDLQAEATPLPENVPAESTVVPSVDFSQMASLFSKELDEVYNFPADYFTSDKAFYSHRLDTSYDLELSLGPRNVLRKIYDEVSTDPNQPSNSLDGEANPERSSNVPLDQLRFEHWVSITELLALAKRETLLKDKIIDEAIEKNLPVSQIRNAQRAQGQFGSPVNDDSRSTSEQSPGTEAVSVSSRTSEELREYVYRLRGIW